MVHHCNLFLYVSSACSFSANTDWNEAECKCWFDVTALLQACALPFKCVLMDAFFSSGVFYVNTVH